MNAYEIEVRLADVMDKALLASEPTVQRRTFAECDARGDDRRRSV